MRSKCSMRNAMMAAVLATSLFSHSWADDQTLESLGAKIESCKQRAAELKEEKAKIERAAQSPNLSQEKKTEAQKVAAAIDQKLTVVTTALQDPALKTNGEKQREILGRAQAAINYGNWVATVADKDLGIPRSGPVDHHIAAKVNIEGLLTEGSRFDGRAKENWVNGDGGFKGSGVGNPYFGIGANTSTPVTVNANYKQSTPESASAIVKNDGSVGGGVMLEDAAVGLGQVSVVKYDGRYNALLLDDRLVYFMKVPSWDAAALCREIARDKRTLVGVSMGKKNFVFGDNPAIYQDADVGYTLMMTDHLLGDFVFGWHNWTKGYKYPDGYQPKAAEVNADMLVRFAFKNFQFTTKEGELVLANLAVDVTMMPVSKEAAKNGGMLPDMDALARGYTPPPEFLANAQYFTSHFDFFRRERIVAKTIAYGELAALFRSFKQAGVNLEVLASAMERG